MQIEARHRAKVQNTNHLSSPRVQLQQVPVWLNIFSLYIFFKKKIFIYLYIYIALHDNSLFLLTEAAVVQLVKWCSKCAVLWEHTQRKPAAGVIKGHSLCLTGA